MKKIGIYCLDQDRKTTSTLGVYHYTRKLIDALAQIQDPPFEIHLLLSSENAADFTPPLLPEWMHVVVVQGSFGTGVRRLVADHLLSIRLARKYGLALVHYPKGWIPLVAMKNTSIIATIHDVIPYEMAAAMETASLAERCKRHYFKAILVRSIKKANYVVTISEHSRKQIVSLCPEVENRVHILHSGPGLPVSNAPLVPRRLRKSFLVIGSMLPHKATEETLCLLGRYAARKNLRLQVQVSGISQLPETWETPSNRLCVKWLGRVSDDDMVAGMSHARAMFFLSTEEGAGLPLIEGFLLETPVIFRDIPPMNEFMDAQLSGWDCVSEDSFFDAVDRALALDEMTLSRTRQSLLKQCNWIKVAEQMADVYRKALCV